MYPYLTTYLLSCDRCRPYSVRLVWSPAAEAAARSAVSHADTYRFFSLLAISELWLVKVSMFDQRRMRGLGTDPAFVLSA